MFRRLTIAFIFSCSVPVFSSPRPPGEGHCATSGCSHLAPVVALLTMFKFADYLSNEWSVLKGIQSLRSYGGDIAQSKLVTVILYDSRGETDEESDRYVSLTNRLRSLGSEFYLHKSYDSYYPDIEIVLRCMVLFGLKHPSENSSVMYFHHNTFFLSNPLINSARGTFSCGGSSVHNYPLLEERFYNLAFKLGLLLPQYTDLLKQQEVTILCSSNLLQVPSDILVSLWTEIAKETASASLEAKDYTESSNDMFLSIAMRQLFVTPYVFPSTVYDSAAHASASVAAAMFSSGESDVSFYVNVSFLTPHIYARLSKLANIY